MFWFDSRARFCWTNSENNDKQVVLIDGVLSTKEKTKQTIHTIEKWTDVFIVYISIYTSAHPEKYQAREKNAHFVQYVHRWSQTLNNR
jgi:hypothetical protein